MPNRGRLSIIQLLLWHLSFYPQKHELRQCERDRWTNRRAREENGNEEMLRCMKRNGEHEFVHA